MIDRQDNDGGVNAVCIALSLHDWSRENTFLECGKRNISCHSINSNGVRFV